MTATYNDCGQRGSALKQEEGNVAAVIVEAVGANMGVVPPKPGFLKSFASFVMSITVC